MDIMKSCLAFVLVFAAPIGRAATIVLQDGQTVTVGDTVVQCGQSACQPTITCGDCVATSETTGTKTCDVVACSGAISSYSQACTPPPTYSCGPCMGDTYEVWGNREPFPYSRYTAYKNGVAVEEMKFDQSGTQWGSTSLCEPARAADTRCFAHN